MATQQIKDILNSTVPSSTWALKPRIAGPLRGDVKQNFSSSDPLRVFDPRKGRLVPKGTDVPRIGTKDQGGRQGLHVKASGQTLYGLYKANIPQWPLRSGVTVDGPAATSIHNDESSNSQVGAAEVTCTTGDGFDNIATHCGDVSPGKQTGLLIIEDTGSNETGFAIRDATNGAQVRTTYDWSSGELTVDRGSPFSKNARVLGQGPNGGRLVELRMTVDESNLSGFTPGNTRRVQVLPDRSGNTQGVIIHHAQMQDDAFVAGPIADGSESVSVSGEGAYVPTGDWWNPNEGTIICSYIPLTVNATQNAQILSASGSSLNRFLFHRATTPDRFAARDAAGNVADPNSGAGAFRLTKAALSIRRQSFSLAINGSVDRTSGHDGSLLQSNYITFAADDPIGIFTDVLYIPAALPDTPADRSSGDPVSLETLTA